MIFVTVGTHEQPFNRLIQKIDELKKDGTIQDDVIIQTGFSTYEPKYCQWSKLIPYQQMVKNVADISNISYRTYYRKRYAAIEVLSTILWGFTAKETIDILNRFFPD